MSKTNDKTTGAPRSLNGLVSSPVTKVNHGKVFGAKDWFTFYCGECGAQLEGRQDHCRCGVIAVWDANSATERNQPQG